MAKVIIDGQEYDLPAGKNLLQAALEAGLDIPYFCWHPGLGSVGACRQCAVKQYRDPEDQRGMIMMSCMVPVTEGARFSVDAPDVREFRESVAEWLMTNHPHDCPVCDEGGECHLQDMTVMTGQNYRNYRFKKRTFRNQNLGPHINHEMNRCITCYRCVRYYDDYAGGKDLQAMASHNHVYFGRHEDGTLQNEFSGNLVEVCPTGVFTDKTFKQHFVRKWDLQTAPGICQGCGLGCNTIPGERFGKLRRILNRYHGDLNGYFICDRGRFGYEYVNASSRPRLPVAREKAGEAVELDPEGLKARLASLIGPDKKILGIGSPRASLESNFALRALAGPEHFSTGQTRAESALLRQTIDLRGSHPAKNPSLRDIEDADAVLILGEDLTNTAPRMALAVRQAVRNQPLAATAALRIPEWSDKAVRIATVGATGPCYAATPQATRLDDVTTARRSGPPEDLARLGYAIAHALDSAAPPVENLSESDQSFVREAADALRQAVNPVVITGTTLGSPQLVSAAANVARALHRDDRPAGLAFVVPEANSLGVALLGGQDLEAALNTVQNGEVDTVVILENDLYRRLSAPAVDALFSSGVPVITIDYVDSRTVANSTLLLPSGPFPEADGTLINFEGRAQRFFQVYVPDGAVQEGWRWIRDLMGTADRLEANSWHSLDNILVDIESSVPALKGVVEAAPPAAFRLVGGRIPRQSRRVSGRTAIHANIEVSEDPPPQDPDSPMSFSMEGGATVPPSALIPRIWSPGWNSVSALNKFQDEIAGPLAGGDPGKLLIPASSNAGWDYANHVPESFSARGGALYLLPAPHIFGSEELSGRVKGILERSPGLFATLHPDDAARLQLTEGDLVKLSLNESSWTLPVHLNPSLLPGTAGIPAGFTGLEGIPLPAWAEVQPAS